MTEAPFPYLRIITNVVGVESCSETGDGACNRAHSDRPARLLNGQSVVTVSVWCRSLQHH